MSEEQKCSKAKKILITRMSRKLYKSHYFILIAKIIGGFKKNFMSPLLFYPLLSINLTASARLFTFL